MTVGLLIALTASYLCFSQLFRRPHKQRRAQLGFGRWRVGVLGHAYCAQQGQLLVAVPRSLASRCVRGSERDATETREGDDIASREGGGMGEEGEEETREWNVRVRECEREMENM